MVAVSFEFTDEQREAYAAQLLRTPSPFDAAVVVFGSAKADIGKVAFVASTWPKDPVIIEITQRLLKGKGVESFLPTKEAAMRRIWEWTGSGFDIEQQIKAMKLLGEFSGWISKPDVVIAPNATINNGVMVIESHGNTETWEESLKRQQTALTKHDAKPALSH